MTPDVTAGVMLAVAIGVLVLVLAVVWAWWSARFAHVAVKMAVADASMFAPGTTVVIGNKHYMQVVRVESDKLVVRRPRR